jgi:hypothetical protein
MEENIKRENGINNKNVLEGILIGYIFGGNIG